MNDEKKSQQKKLGVKMRRFFFAKNQLAPTLIQFFFGYLWSTLGKKTAENWYSRPDWSIFYEALSSSQRSGFRLEFGRVRRSKLFQIPFPFFLSRARGGEGRTRVLTRRSVRFETVEGMPSVAGARRWRQGLHNRPQKKYFRGWPVRHQKPGVWIPNCTGSL